MVGFFNVLPLELGSVGAGHRDPRARARAWVSGSWDPGCPSARISSDDRRAPARRRSRRGPVRPRTRPPLPPIPRRRPRSRHRLRVRRQPAAVGPRRGARDRRRARRVGALFVSGWTLGRQSALTPGTPSGEAEAFQPFWDTYRAVTERYAGGDVDRKAIIEGAIKGMIGALDDPYSQYLTSRGVQGQPARASPASSRGSGHDRHGRRGGRRPRLHRRSAPDCRLVVVAPLAGSPAEKAGLRPGDVIDRDRRRRRSAG